MNNNTSLSIKGIWSISNVFALKLLDIEYGIPDVACVQFNEDTPERVAIKYDKDNEPYIMYNHSKLYFNECMRT